MVHREVLTEFDQERLRSYFADVLTTGDGVIKGVSLVSIQFVLSLYIWASPVASMYLVVVLIC